MAGLTCQALMSGLLGLHVDNHAFGSEQASRGSKSSFDRLPRQEIASRNCWRGRFGPEYRKMDRHIWGSCRVGPGFGRIFRIFSEWSEMVLEGLRTISWGSGGRFWGQLFVFGPWKVSLIFQVTIPCSPCQPGKARHAWPGMARPGKDQTAGARLEVSG